MASLAIADLHFAHLLNSKRMVSAVRFLLCVFLFVAFAFNLKQETIACASDGSAKFFSTNLKGFGIPFNVDASDASLLEVQLFVSEDLGNTWSYYGRQPTSAKEFPFQAKGDGEYWFALKTLNVDRQLVPDGPPRPELKIVIDSIKPSLKFNIDTDAAGRIVCDWDARDALLNSGSVKLLYRQPGVMKTWKRVPFQNEGVVSNGMMQDRLAWWPEQSGTAVEIRCEVADAAGNMVFEERIVKVPSVDWRNKPTSTAYKQRQPLPKQVFKSLPPVPNQPVAKKISGKGRMVCSNGQCRFVPAEELAKLAATGSGGTDLSSMIGSEEEYAAPPEPDVQTAPNQSPTKLARQPDLKLETPATQFSRASSPESRKARPDSIAWESESTGIPDLKSEVENSTQGSDEPWNKKGSANDSLADVDTNVIKDLPDGMFVSESTTQSTQWKPAKFKKTEWNSSNQMSLPTTPVRNQEAGSSVAKTASTSIPTEPVSFKRLPDLPSSKSFLSQKDLEAIQVINLKRFNLDYSIDAIDPSGVQKVVLWMTRDGGNSWKSWSTDPDNQSPMPVEIEDPGIYGFRIVIHSKDGLTGLAPVRGDDPDIMVKVDINAPVAKILSVPYGQGAEAGRLVINWEASDENLALRPITLAYSTSPQGPWTQVEHGLRNTGKYVWKVGTQVPEKIFLKLEARDTAGNVGVYQLNQMIDISGLVPRGRIRGIQPMTR